MQPSHPPPHHPMNDDTLARMRQQASAPFHQPSTHHHDPKHASPIESTINPRSRCARLVPKQAAPPPCYWSHLTASRPRTTTRTLISSTNHHPGPPKRPPASLPAAAPRLQGCARARARALTRAHTLNYLPRRVARTDHEQLLLP